MAHTSKREVVRNFEIPAQFIFQPFSADWQLVSAETVEWVDESEGQTSLLTQLTDVFGNPLLRVRIGASYTVLMDRASIPPDVLPADENHRNTPEVAGRLIQVLICQKWSPQPGDTTRDAKQMRDEFVNLSLDNDDDWPRSLRQFLNRWGLWESNSVLVSPYSLRKQQDNYRKAALKNSGREWLSTHTLRGFAQDVPPYFFVRRNYCRDAIEAAITIDHLESCDFGICRRHDCRKLFERTSGQRRIYCSIECAHLANVRKLRAAKKRAERKGKEHSEMPKASKWDGVYQHPDSPFWWCSFTDASGKRARRKLTGSQTRTQAVKMLDAIRLQEEKARTLGVRPATEIPILILVPVGQSQIISVPY